MIPFKQIFLVSLLLIGVTDLSARFNTHDEFHVEGLPAPAIPVEPMPEPYAEEDLIAAVNACNFGAFEEVLNRDGAPESLADVRRSAPGGGTLLHILVNAAGINQDARRIAEQLIEYGVNPYYRTWGGDYHLHVPKTAREELEERLSRLHHESDVDDSSDELSANQLNEVIGM